MKPRRKNVVRPTIRVILDGSAGSGKTQLLETLRDAGWEVGPEKPGYKSAGFRVIAEVAMPPRRTVATRRKAGR